MDRGRLLDPREVARPAALRAGPRLHHFGALYDGLWVCPHDRVEQVLGLLDEVGVTTATVLRSGVVPGSPAGGAPARAFDLAPLDAAYLAFAER